MSRPELSTTTRKKPWVLTFFGLLAASDLLAMPFFVGAPDAAKMPDMVRFLGHFHPVFLHLPIGVFALIILQELWLMVRKKGGASDDASLYPLFFGAISAGVAAVLGFLLYHGEAEFSKSELVEQHLWAGLFFAVAAVLTLLAKLWTVAMQWNPMFYRLLLFVSVGIMGFASHEGASITHGENYLTEYAPESIQKLMAPQANAEDKKSAQSVSASTVVPSDPVVYSDIVAPILERRCLQCHKESKFKGKFRMDTYELLVKGGKSGSGLEPGNSAESNIIIRMDLPLDDEEHMPPEGKPDIEDSEVAIIKWWIDNGADAKKKLSQSPVPPAIQEAINKLTAAVSPAKTVLPPAIIETDKNLLAAVSNISKEFPGTLTFESQQSQWLTFTAVSMRANFDDAGFKKLAPVLSQLVSLDLSATKITDQSVAQLSVAKNLRLIRLSETSITDLSIDTLVQLSTLESINLYGTYVTDVGVSKLSLLPNLKRLYLWKTSVTPDAIKRLKEKLPACEIVTGIEA